MHHRGRWTKEPAAAASPQQHGRPRRSNNNSAQCTKNRIYEAYKIRLRVKLFIGNVYAWTNNNESLKNFADKFMMVFAHSEIVQQTQLVFFKKLSMQNTL